MWQALQRPEPPRFPIDTTLQRAVKRRMQLALRIDSSSKQGKKARPLRFGVPCVDGIGAAPGLCICSMCWHQGGMAAWPALQQPSSWRARMLLMTAGLHPSLHACQACATMPKCWCCAQAASDSRWQQRMAQDLDMDISDDKGDQAPQQGKGQPVSKAQLAALHRVSPPCCLRQAPLHQ